MEVVLPLLIKWQWGTTENFVYGVKGQTAQRFLANILLLFFGHYILF